MNLRHFPQGRSSQRLFSLSNPRRAKSQNQPDSEVMLYGRSKERRVGQLLENCTHIAALYAY